MSWALRSTQDQDISDCAGGRIDQIVLLSDTGNAQTTHAFPCADNHGVTAFDLPTGAVALSISPTCASGALPVPGTFEAPPPIVRNVAIGQAVTLDALLLVVEADCQNHVCICAP
ncbi:MAG: hypothetical protein R3B06_13675 [Kofleriaceae bacterium]